MKNDVLLRDDINSKKLLNIILVSAGFGFLFGTVASISYYIMNDALQSNFWYYLLIPVISGTISGLAGAGGSYLDHFLIRLGLNHRAWRQVIVFMILATIIQGGAISYLNWSVGEIGDQYRQYLLIGIIGCLFGAMIAVFEYHFGEIRAKMIALELENKYLAEITAKEEELKEITKNLVISEERNRVARELHDSISQGIHGIIFTVHSLKNNLPPENNRLIAIAAHLEETAQATMSELRAMILELKPVLLNERGLVEALKLHGEMFSRRQQIALDFQLDNISDLSSKQEMAIYRIVQEALANIGRHAGASQVKIILQKNEVKQSVLTICDNGKGFDPEKVKKGNGLENMVARCREVGGEFQIKSELGKGTQIVVVI